MAASVSKVGSLGAAVLMLAAVLCSCGGGAEASKGSPLCRALDAKVPGVDVISWDNGVTSQQATWGALLDDGILEGDRSTLEAAAEAVRRPSNGFDRVLAAAPEDLRPALQRLDDLLRDPDGVVARRHDAAVRADIKAVSDATPPELCGWMR